MRIFKELCILLIQKLLRVYGKKMINTDLEEKDAEHFNIKTFP